MKKGRNSKFVFVIIAIVIVIGFLVYHFKDEIGLSPEEAGLPELSYVYPSIISNGQNNSLKIIGQDFDSTTQVVVNLIPLPSSSYTLINDHEIDVSIPQGFIPGSYSFQVSDGVTLSNATSAYLLEEKYDSMPPFGASVEGTLTADYSSDVFGYGPGWTLTYYDSSNILTYYFVEREVQSGLFTVHVKYNDYESIIPLKDAGTLYRNGGGTLLFPLSSRTNTPSLVNRSED